mmetsp:Transcript_79754/g.165711  ORF Transcript_79754/g.165711 Transcript_79754/m.165711 type:complete len:163 (+) Transcript_79754:100-588(+)
MVLKTDLCAYSEYRIYPGRGSRFVARDGKVSFLLNAKVTSLFHQRIKAVKLRWTQAWRRMNKKGKTDDSAKKKTRKAKKFQKAVVGMSVEDLQKKKAMKTEIRQQAAAAEAAKAAKAKAAAKNKAAAKGKAAAQPKNKGKDAPKAPKGGAVGGGKKDFKARK